MLREYRMGNCAFEMADRDVPLLSSEKQRTQNVLRIFLDPLLDALGRLGTSAYMPMPRADSCLQLLARLLHSCVPRGPGAQDGEDEQALGTMLGCCCCSEWEDPWFPPHAHPAPGVLWAPSWPSGGLFTITRMCCY